MRTLIFDTETTGLLQPSIVPLEKQPSIISFYANVIDDEGQVVEELDFHCNPGFPIGEIITKITGITNDDLKDKPPFSEFEEKVRNIIDSCEIACAHNAKFDIGMVSNEMRRCGTFELLKWHQIVCTVEATMHMRGHRLNLTKLHTELFGVPFSDAHSAKGDVTALTKCYIELRKRGMV